MGSVYRALDLRSGDEVALKRLRSNTGTRDVVLFEREYQTLVSIQHPRIVRAYDYGVDATGPYYTMELVRGTDLHELAPVQAREACRHVRDVASCLALLHTRRLLHRDITPRNVRVLADGTCKLLDFGALTTFGVPDRVVGTPPFIPPEALQAQGALDQRSDIFSLGALLYWTLTRKHAYPARRIEALSEVWRERPIAPRTLAPDVPVEVDTLVMRMLNVDPMARPANMAEVVQRLDAVADLEPEPEETRHALAQSYLVHADFVGRDLDLAALQEKVTALDEGRGSATLIEGVSGVGRTRMLTELRVYGALQGFNTLHLDGDDCRRDDHAAVSIVRHLLATSAHARRQAQGFTDTLVSLGPGVTEYLTSSPTRPVSAIAARKLPECVVAMMRAACAEMPIVFLVDNLDEVDDASLATLASLTRLTNEAPLCLVLTARTDVAPRSSILWLLLREQCETRALGTLSSDEAILLARSMFGDAPNLVRCAHWLHEQSGGLPLHFIELARRLLASGEITHDGTQWRLPGERPEQMADDGFADLIATRLTRLSVTAHALAEALSVQRTALSRALCFDLAATEGGDPRTLLEELTRHDVITPSLYGFSFAHATLRDALIEQLTPERRRVLHLRCAEQALASSQHRDRRRAMIEAGWHLLEAGEESRGAEQIAEAAVDTVAVRFALADVPDYAPALETALAVYVKQNRPLLERLPLMATLAQAGYYGDRSWGERYGNAAIAAVAEASGLTLARKLKPFLGRSIAAVVGLGIAFLRFTFTRKHGPAYGFRDVLVQLFGVVTTLTGAASIALDVDRATRVAATLEPFLGLPQRLTPVGIAQFCAGLKEIARDNQAAAMRSWTTLLDRFRDPSYYPALPEDGRVLYIGGLWFAIGANSVSRDGDDALKAADALDALDIKLYRMIASAIRAQYHAHRGQLDEARRYRRQVDDHAVQVGSAWQAELWEPSSLILVHTTMGDMAEMRRVADRLQTLAQDVPSLKRYAEFAELAFQLTAEEDFVEIASDSARAERVLHSLREAVTMLDAQAPRSMAGWGAIGGYCARALNLLGRYGEAKQLAERLLSDLDASDRMFVAMFLNLELERAVADAHLGDRAGAKRQLDALSELHKHSDNPLTRGRLHEAYARVAASQGAWDDFRHQLAQVRAWYAPTGSASLIARVEAMRALDPAEHKRSGRGAATTIRETAESLGVAVAAERDADDDATSQAQTRALDK